MIGYGSAPGKVILTGEHSVVYGFPAIATALDLHCKVKTTSNQRGLYLKSIDLNSEFQYSFSQLQSLTSGNSISPQFDNIVHALLQFNNPEDLNIRLDIKSQLPISAGLGSSAAVSVASICSVIDYFGYKFSKSEINEFAFKAEQVTHGTPSGIDNSIATLGGLIYFENGSIQHHNLEDSIPLIILNTKIPRDTKFLVSSVRDKKSKIPKIINPILDAMGELVNEFMNSLRLNDLEAMGRLMTMNQYLLDAIGVGHSKITRLVDKALNIGAFGAKLTGAGGGGCIIVLTDENNQDKIARNLQEDGIDVLQTKLSPQGFKIGTEGS